MAETNTAEKAVTAATERAAVNRAAKAAAVSASEVAKALPTVVETTELAMEVPAKVVLNQKLVVTASVVAGALLTAGAIWGVNRFRNRKRSVVEVVEDVVTKPSTGE